MGSIGLQGQGFPLPATALIWVGGWAGVFFFFSFV